MTTDTHPLYRRARRSDLTIHAVGARPRVAHRPHVDATRAARSTPKPAWMLLYALLPLCAGLFALLDYLPVSGGQRTLAEGVVVVLLMGLAAIWVRANRRALSRMPFDPETETGPTDLRVEVHEPSPRVIHLCPWNMPSESERRPPLSE